MYVNRYNVISVLSSFSLLNCMLCWVYPAHCHKLHIDPSNFSFICMHIHIKGRNFAFIVHLKENEWQLRLISEKLLRNRTHRIYLCITFFTLRSNICSLYLHTFTYLSYGSIFYLGIYVQFINQLLTCIMRSYVHKLHELLIFIVDKIIITNSLFFCQRIYRDGCGCRFDSVILQLL